MRIFSKPMKWVFCMAMIVVPLLLLMQWTSFVKRKHCTGRFRFYFPVDEFHRDNEPVSYFQTKRGQLHHCRSLCKRFSRYWYGLPAYKSGLQDCILCGGAQEVNPYAVGSFDGLSAFSTQEAAPEKASKPFDKRRDGLIPSGGAASLVLESYESAVKEELPFWPKSSVTVFIQWRSHLRA